MQVPCQITLNFYDWRMAVSRLALCAAFYSWVVDFERDPRDLPKAINVIGKSATACYNIGAILGVQFYPGLPKIKTSVVQDQLKEMRKPAYF